MEKHSPSIYKPEFIPFYLGIKKQFSLNDTETKLYGFIRFYTSFEDRAFYFSNEQLAEILDVSLFTVSRAFSVLEEKGLLLLEYEIKKGGGKIRRSKVNSDLRQTASQTCGKQQGNTYKEKKYNNITKSNGSETAEEPEKSVQTSIIKAEPTKKKKSPSQYGNSDINDLIEYFKTRFGLPMLDDSVKANRRFCYLLIKKFKTVEKCKELIDIAAEDRFWSTRITSFRTLYYKAVSIVSATRESKFSVTKV